MVHRPYLPAQPGGHLTDRFTKAVAQLGDTTVHVRVGAIYSLERMAHDSTRDRHMTLYVLGAFIRGQSREERKVPDVLAEDVFTALRTVSRLLPGTNLILDLRGADLRHADLSDLPHDRVWLERAMTSMPRCQATGGMSAAPEDARYSFALADG